MTNKQIKAILLLPLAAVFAGLRVLVEFLHFKVSSNVLRWFRMTDKRLTYWVEHDL